MITQNVSIVSIHPDPVQPLELDIKHILSALGPAMQGWIWCVRNLEWLGENAEAFNRRVDAAGAAGLWVPAQELLDAARGVYQTIEGEFQAFPHEVDPEETLALFPASQAELAIVAVDGGFFEVYAKDPEVLARLRNFKDVRNEDPRVYF